MYEIEINLILTYDKVFHSLIENDVSPLWAQTFNEASKIVPDIQCLDVMPGLISQMGNHDKIWLRNGTGHFTSEANKYIASFLWEKFLTKRKSSFC